MKSVVVAAEQEDEPRFRVSVCVCKDEQMKNGARYLLRARRRAMQRVPGGSVQPEVSGTYNSESFDLGARDRRGTRQKVQKRKTSTNK